MTANEVGVSELEAAYKARVTDDGVDISIPYALTANNAYYRTLFREVVPEDVDLDLIANSELESGVQAEPLPGEAVLFGGASGMSLLRDADANAFVLEAKGKLMLRGIFARLAGKYAMTLVDSPALLTRQEQQILAANGLGVEQGTGINVLVDFQNMSGSNGDTLLIESLLVPTSDTTAVFVALRKMLDDSVCFDTPDGGICPNFASKEALSRAYESALDELSTEQVLEFLRRPIKFKNVKRDYMREIVASVYGDRQMLGKPSVEELSALIELFPGLQQRFSDRVLSYVTEKNQGGIPKNLLSASDRRLIQSLRNANGALLIELLTEEIETNPNAIPTQLKGTELCAALLKMGYEQNALSNALKSFQASKGVYKVI